MTAILRRHPVARLTPLGDYPTASRRFEYSGPNELWQMDIKGDGALGQDRCYPLTVLDDLARCFASTDFRILADNGAPFGTAGKEAFGTLEVWLMRLGVKL